MVAPSLALAVLSSPASAEGGPVVTSDLLRVRTVSAIDVTRDGATAVYAVRTIGRTANDDEGERSSRTLCNRSHLWAIDLSDARATPRQLTFGDRNDSAPRISPDGRRVAFVRNGDASGTPAQVWVLPLDGGEARPLTNLENGAGGPTWSPDGSRLLVTSSLSLEDLDGRPAWSMERPRRDWKDVADDVVPSPDGSREEIRAWLAGNARESDPVVIARLEFQEERGLREEHEFSHLYLLDPDATDEPPRRLTDGFTNHDFALFMPDGERVVYLSSTPGDSHLDRVRERSIRWIAVDGSDDRLLVEQDGWTFHAPVPGRDGSVIAFLGRPNDEPGFRQWRLGLAAVDGPEAGRPTWLTDEDDFDRSVSRFAWLQTQTAIAFTASRNGGDPLFTVSPATLEPTPLVDQADGLPVGVSVFAVGGGSIVYEQVSADNPSALRVQDRRGDRALVDLNPWIADRAVSRPVRASIRRDGMEIEYWVMEPTGRESGKTYPTVLAIHGGPQSMWGPGEQTMWHEFQLLASWGYGVVYANPRGSGGYGYAFQKANFQDWGDGPAGDVLAALDDAASRNEWIDADRLVITGGSYGGYLTAWIVGHDNRFKAAVAQRGVYHLLTFFGEGNAWQLVEHAFGGHPWEARIRPVLQRESPFTYVNRIMTPLLIMHGSSDLRTGVSQSEMMYRALKHLDRPVEFVRYPDAGHELSRSGDPTQRMDRLNRIIEFFERHVENARPAPGSAGSAEPGTGRASEADADN